MVHTIPVIFGEYNTKDSVNGECTTPMTSGSTGNCQVGDYMTHPTFLSIPSNGFWVGKFETSKSNSNADNSINPNGVQIKPNVISWRNIQVANAFYTTYDYKRNLDSHMMKNTEWGAVAYLQHSEYGSHKKVRFNNNSDYKTGYASVSEPLCGYTNDNRDCNKYGTTADITKPYNTEAGYLASTTGNITGIYDMSGGAWEYMMSMIIDSSGNPLSGLNTATNSGFNGKLGEGGSISTGYSWPIGKYYDKYYYVTSKLDYIIRILGDATGEMGPFFAYNGALKNVTSWYSERADTIFNQYPYFARGGSEIMGEQAGIFSFGYDSGAVVSVETFRVVLTPQ